MTKLMAMSAAIAAALLLAAAGTANAGERIESSGYDACIIDVWDELALDEGHSLALYKGRCVTFLDDPSAAGHMSTGECAGTYEFMPDESWNGSGYCTWTYRDGDTLFLKFWEGSDMEVSRYDWVGGTGRYAGATGGGTYTGEELTDTLSASRWKEVIELP